MYCAHYTERNNGRKNALITCNICYEYKKLDSSVGSSAGEIIFTLILYTEYIITFKVSKLRLY